MDLGPISQALPQASLCWKQDLPTLSTAEPDTVLNATLYFTSSSQQACKGGFPSPFGRFPEAQRRKRTRPRSRSQNSSSRLSAVSASLPIAGGGGGPGPLRRLPIRRARQHQWSYPLGLGKTIGSRVKANTTTPLKCPVIIYQVTDSGDVGGAKEAGGERKQR